MPERVDGGRQRGGAPPPPSFEFDLATFPQIRCEPPLDDPQVPAVPIASYPDGDAVVIHPKPDRVYGPEPWKTLRGETLDYWDLWFLVAMGDLPHGKQELVGKLKLKGRDTRDRRNTEAKLAHLLDLETRLLVLGLTHEDVLADVITDKRLRRRANEKVLERAVDGHLSSAMVNTPRKLLSDRAMRGYWDRFPVNPSTLGPLLGHKLTKPSGHYDYRTTPVMLELLRSKWRTLRSDAASTAAKVAVDRLVLTVAVGLMEHIDDDDHAGPVFDDVLDAYIRDVWTSGIDPEILLRDGIEFGVWEDYGLTDDFKVFLEAISKEHLGLVSKVFAETRAELIMNGLEHEHGCLMRLWVTYALHHELMAEFEWLSQRLQGDGWSHEGRAEELVEVALRLGREDVAEAVKPTVPTI